MKVRPAQSLIPIDEREISDLRKRKKSPPGRQVLPAGKIFTDTEIHDIKESILEVLEAEICDTLSSAADYLNVPKLQVHYWFKNDKDFKHQVESAQQITADRLEEKLDQMNHPIALIFRLKKLRPEYRDNYKFNVTSENMERLLQELRASAQRASTEIPAEAEPPKEVTDAIPTV